MRELTEAEEGIFDLSSGARFAQERFEEGMRMQLGVDRRTSHSSMDFLMHQDAAALRRAGCELRVLVRSLQTLEGEIQPAPRASAGGFGSAAKGRDTSPRPVGRPPTGKAPPRAPKRR